MKEGWKIKKLGDVCEIIGGGTPPKDNSSFYNGNIFWATVRDMKGNFINETEHKITKDAVKNSSTNIIPKGNVIIATRVGLGRICLAQNDTAINQDLKGILPKSNSTLLIGYLFQWFKSISHLIIEEGTGATVQGVKLSFIRELDIPLPPLAEQQRIVTILDEAFDAIAKAKANAEQNLKNAKELYESHLEGVFENKCEDWKEKTLGEVVDFFNGFAFKSKDVVEASNTQLIRMGNLYQNQLDLERRAVFYPDQFASSYKKYLLEEDDLIISLTGTTDKEDYGYTVRIPANSYNLLLNQRIAKISIKNEKVTNKDYLFHFLLSRTFLDKLYKTANGTRQANLSTETMKSLSIVLPSLNEQQRIVQKLDALSRATKKLEAIYQKKLEDLEELKKSILQKAFSGELSMSELGFVGSKDEKIIKKKNIVLHS